MEYKELVKHHTQIIKDQNQNKWEVIETSDLEEICEAYHQEKLKLLGIDDVISSALPCPFCGEKPKVDKSYMPTEVEISCVNHNCHARPSVYESVKCVENKGDSVTYTPMFEWHWQSVLDKWNTRHCL